MQTGRSPPDKVGLSGGVFCTKAPQHRNYICNARGLHLSKFDTGKILQFGGFIVRFFTASYVRESLGIRQAMGLPPSLIPSLPAFQPPLPFISKDFLFQIQNKEWLVASIVNLTINLSQREGRALCGHAVKHLFSFVSRGLV